MLAEGAQVVHELEARRGADVVDRGEVGQEVECAGRIVAQEGAHFDQGRRCELRGQVAAVRVRRDDGVGKPLAQREQQGMLGRHLGRSGLAHLVPAVPAVSVPVAAGGAPARS
jgi:hypothetical protein